MRGDRLLKIVLLLQAEAECRRASWPKSWK